MLSRPTTVSHARGVIIILMLPTHASNTTLYIIRLYKKIKCEAIRAALTWLSVLGREEEYRFTTYHIHKRRISAQSMQIGRKNYKLLLLLTSSINIENGVDLLSVAAGPPAISDIYK